MRLNRIIKFLKQGCSKFATRQHIITYTDFAGNEMVAHTLVNTLVVTKRRIMDMGITKGVSVYVRKVAPLGDPVEVTVRGYELSLRKADAEMIEVE